VILSPRNTGGALGDSEEPRNMNLPISYMARVARRAPRLARDMVQGFLHKSVRAPLECHLGTDGRASTIKEIDLKITNMCNLRCRMCAQWGQAAYNYDRPSEALREVVPAKYYKQMVDDCAHSNPLYYIWGGEPMMYPDILEVLAHIKSCRNPVALITNGTLIEKHAPELVRMNLDCIMVSLDGPRDLHDEIRGVPGTFDALRAGLQSVLHERAMRGQITPILILLITINTANVNAIAETVKIAEQLGADFVGIYWSWFTSREIGDAHTRFMQEHFCVTPTAWKGFLLDTVEMDVERLVEEVRRLRRLRLRIPVLFVPHLSDNQIGRYYRDPAHTFGYRRCYAPWYLVEIGPNGDVSTCRDHPDFVCGNIREEPLPVIFNNERFRSFRRVLKEHKLIPICGRCCGLMGF